MIVISKFLASFLWLVAFLATTGAAKPPNIVVFLTDDMGWGDLGCYGHPVIKSPNLDRLVEEGVTFTISPNIWFVTGCVTL